MGRIQRVKRGLFFLLFVSLSLGSPVFAQKITGDISGVVTDSSGAVVPNVAVTAENLGTKLTRTANTNESGSYRINDLAIGTYRVAVSLSGFKTTQRNVDVSAGSLTTSNFSLQVGQRSETIEVEGTAPLVESSPNNNNYVDNAKIESVPLNGRDFNSLLAITPGVQRAPGTG